MAAVAAAMIVVVVGVVVVRMAGEQPRTPTAGGATPLDRWQQPDPEDDAWKVAQAQVDALLGDNEQAWLALVDPAQPDYLPRYRTLFRTLQAMKINHAEALVAPPQTGADGATFDVGFSYCFAGSPCPTALDQPKMVKRVTLKADRDRHLITTVDWDPDSVYNLDAPPWGDEHLVIAEGRRVVAAASASQATHLPRIIALADRAATDLDRFGRHLPTPQDRYRIFLADDQDWATWHGGDQPAWTVGYAFEVAGVGMDVVLNAGKVLAAGGDAQVVVRHEMGHVLTLIGATPPDNPLQYLFNDKNQWLREGIAEYIGQNARPPQYTDRRPALQRAFRSADPPTSIAASAVYEGSERGAVSGLYAMGYFASACMAAQYGEAPLFQFADLVLRGAKTADAASRAVYRKPFTQVDRGCLAWIRQRV